MTGSRSTPAPPSYLQDEQGGAAGPLLRGGGGDGGGGGRGGGGSGLGLGAERQDDDVLLPGATAAAGGATGGAATAQAAAGGAAPPAGPPRRHLRPSLAHASPPHPSPLLSFAAAAADSAAVAAAARPQPLPSSSILTAAAASAAASGGRPPRPPPPQPPSSSSSAAAAPALHSRLPPLPPPDHADRRRLGRGTGPLPPLPPLPPSRRCAVPVDGGASVAAYRAPQQQPQQQQQQQQQPPLSASYFEDDTAGGGSAQGGSGDDCLPRTAAGAAAGGGGQQKRAPPQWPPPLPPSAPPSERRSQSRRSSWRVDGDPPLAGLRLLFVPNPAAAALVDRGAASGGKKGGGSSADGQAAAAAEQLFAAAAAAAAAATSSPSSSPPQRRPSSRQSRRGSGGAAAACRISAICWLAVALSLGLLFLQAISCGFFFCVAPGLPQLGARLPRSSTAAAAAAAMVGLEDGGDLGAAFGELVVPLGRMSDGVMVPQLEEQQQQQQQQQGGALLSAPAPPGLSDTPWLLWRWSGLGFGRAGGGSRWPWFLRSPAQDAALALAATSPTTGGGGAGIAGTGAAAGAAGANTPRLVPRVLHQTWPARRVPPQRRALARTCARAAGPGWTVRVWDDASAAALVRQAFPEYFEAYASLPRDVERADFFRYMALLRFGGVVADTDVECVRPLDDAILPADTLVAGWGAFADVGGPRGGAEAEAGATAAAAGPLPPRQRTLATWMLAAAPGHPALRELCERVAHGAAATFSPASAVRDTAERTGAGVLTDVLLRHASGGGAVGGGGAWGGGANSSSTIPGGGAGVVGRGGRPHSGQDPWRVRILPLVAFGAPAAGAGPAGITRASPGVVAVHHALGTWEGRAEARAAAVLLRRAEKAAWASRRQGGAGPAAAAADANADADAAPSPDASAVRAALRPDPPLGLPEGVAYYPVAVAFDPPFAALVPPFSRLPAAAAARAASSAPGGQGDDGGEFAEGFSGDAAVGAALLAWGDWQPGNLPAHRRPTLLDAVIGALATRAGAPGADVAAAAAHDDAAAAGSGRGGDDAAAAVAAAAASSALAPSRPATLVDVGAGLGLFSLAAAARGHRAIAFELAPRSLSALRAAVAHNGFGGLVTPLAAAVSAEAGRVCLDYGGAAPAGGPSRAGPAAADRCPGAPAERSLRVSRGYAAACDGGPAAAPQEKQPQPLPSQPLPPQPPPRPCARHAQRVTLSDVLGNETSVGALRIGAAHGHEARVLDGALLYLRRVARPAVVAVEFSPAAMAAAGDPGGAARLLRRLHAELGYRDVAHAGPLCDERWANATGPLPAGSALLRRRPTWCKLPASQFDALVARALQKGSEAGEEQREGEEGSARRATAAPPLLPPPESLLFMLPRDRAPSASSASSASLSSSSLSLRAPQA